MALSTRGRSKKPPDKIQAATARTEKTPSSEVERGVKKQARQTNAVPADLNLRIVFSVFTGLNYNASFTSFDS